MKSRAWIEEAWAWDLQAALAAGVAAGILTAIYGVSPAPARTVLLAIAGAGVALLAVTLTALAILAAFSDLYLEVLRRVGIRDVLRPYQVVAGASLGAAVAGGTSAALVGADLFVGVEAFLIGLSTLFVSWSLAGTASLVGITGKHLKSRADLNAELDEAKRNAAQFRRSERRAEIG